MADELDERENLKNYFHYFVGALHVLSLAEPERCQEMDSYNAMGDQKRCAKRGASRAKSPLSKLTATQIEKIRELVGILDELPVEVINAASNTIMRDVLRR